MIEMYRRFNVSWQLPNAQKWVVTARYQLQTDTTASQYCTLHGTIKASFKKNKWTNEQTNKPKQY